MYYYDLIDVISERVSTDTMNIRGTNNDDDNSSSSSSISAMAIASREHGPASLPCQQSTRVSSADAQQMLVVISYF
jgi:hypothetical protein